MKTYKIKSSAVRAAKKEMGEDWMDFAEIQATADGEFEIILKPTQAITKTIESVQLLADNQADIDAKAAKKAEIESRKPVHIPAKPSHEAVEAPVIIKSAPALPAFLKSSPPAPAPVAEFDPESDESQKQADEMETSPDFAALLAQADAQANVASVNVDPLRPRLSTTELPTKKVWHIADEMMDAAKKAGAPMPKRKEVIEECVRRGVAYGTARTQYQHWFKTMNDSACAPIAVIGKDGKVVMPK